MVRLNKLVIYFLILSACYVCCTQVKSVKEVNYCVGDIWYKIAETANPDKIFCTIDVPDSSLFYHFINNEERLRITFFGAIYNVDSFKVIHHLMGAYNLDNTIVIGQTTTSLMKFEKYFLDSLIQKTQGELRIEILDTITQQKWEFTKCKKKENEDKDWFNRVPAWLLY
jgi:hypothetical protein